VHTLILALFFCRCTCRLPQPWQAPGALYNHPPPPNPDELAHTLAQLRGLAEADCCTSWLECWAPCPRRPAAPACYGPAAYTQRSHSVRCVNPCGLVFAQRLPSLLVIEVSAQKVPTACYRFIALRWYPPDWARWAGRLSPKDGSPRGGHLSTRNRFWLL